MTMATDHQMYTSISEMAKEIDRKLFPVLIVNITRKKTNDNRPGYSRSATSRDLAKRIEKRWRVKDLVPVWDKNANKGPGAVIAVYSRESNGSRVREIVASFLIDRTKPWEIIDESNRYCMPLTDKENHNALGLNGKFIRGDSFNFKQNQCYHFIFINKSGGWQYMNEYLAYLLENGRAPNSIVA